jgi:manganese transport protein
MDFSGREERLLAEALRLVGAARPAIALFHVVESPAAQHLGDLAQDEETAADAARLEAFADQLRGHGFAVETALGMGHPVRELARLAEAFGADLLILGGHGHRWLRDLVLGTTADQLRHRVRAAVLVVPPG